MTTVVMGPALDLPRAHGQQRGRPVEGLDLGLLVDTQDQSPLGWVEVEPTMSRTFSMNRGSRRKFERLGPMRLQGKGPPDTADGALTQAGTRSHGARAPVGCIRRRRLQGEGHDPLHIGVRDGAWAAGRGSSSRPSRRRSMNRARHFPTRLLGQTDLPATTVLVLPSEQRRMIRDRRASAWAVVGRRFQRSRLSRSSEKRCKGGMGRPMAMVTSMSVSWRVHPSKYFRNAFITQDTREGRLALLS